jgi:hypothetical protein
MYFLIITMQPRLCAECDCSQDCLRLANEGRYTEFYERTMEQPWLENRRLLMYDILHLIGSVTYLQEIDLADMNYEEAKLAHRPETDV